MPNEDINIRIDKSTHKKLKTESLRYGLPVKQIVAMLANFGVKKTLEAIQEQK